MKQHHDMGAVKEALARLRRGTRSESGGVVVQVYPGAAGPGPDAEAYGEADDDDKELPGHVPDDEEERR